MKPHWEMEKSSSSLCGTFFEEECVCFSATGNIKLHKWPSLSPELGESRVQNKLTQEDKR